MRVAFDSSVIVAGSISGHAFEDRAAPWFKAARDGLFEATASAHAMAETWATLTALPIKPRIAPATAERLLLRFSSHVRVVASDWGDYQRAIERCSDRGLRSGSIYDALHLIAAERSSADLLLTFNTRHFIRLSAAGGPKVLAPPDPPGLLL